jgi:hypothetical protein
MRKEYMIFAAVVILIAAIGLLYYYPTGDDVRIAKLDAPQYLGLKETGELTVTFRNNALIPVNVSIDIENAFINENGTSSNYINQKSPHGKLTLLPGNNTEHFFLGYLVPGTHNVKVKVYQNGQVIDTGSINVTVLVPQRPELSLQLAYRKETTADYDTYKIYGYIMDGKTGTYRYDVPVQITIIYDKTGEIVSNDTEDYHVGQGGITALSKWKGRPMAVIELAHNEPSSETYLPVQNVAKGMSGDRYRVNVTASWYDPWYDQRFDQWYEQYGRSYDQQGYWYDMSGKRYDPPQFDQVIIVNDELVIPPK